MEIIETIDDMVGKRISRVKEIDAYERLVFYFDCGSVCIIDATPFFDYAEMEIVQKYDLPDSEKLMLGLITEEDILNKQKKAEEKRKAEQEKRDRELYEKLKLKFGGKS